MKKLLSFTLIVMLVFIMAGCAGNEDKKVDNSADVKQEEPNSVSSTTAEENIILFGDKENSGYWNLGVNKVEELTEIKGHEEGDVVKSTGKFVVVLLDMKNISLEPQTYSFYEFKLLDQKTGKVYSVQDNVVDASNTYVSEEKYYKKNPLYITIMDEVNPDDTKLGAVAFDVNTELNLNDLVLVNENDGSDKPVKFKLSN